MTVKEFEARHEQRIAEEQERIAEGFVQELKQYIEDDDTEAIEDFFQHRLPTVLDGKVFLSITEAARSIGHSLKRLLRVMEAANRQPTNYHGHELRMANSGELLVAARQMLGLEVEPMKG